MKADMTDDKLRSLFLGMRQEDAAAAPDFSRLTSATATAAAAAMPHSPVWNRALAIAAALVLCVGAALCWQRVRQSAADIQSWTALSNWQAPSDGLLTASSTPWGATVTSPTDTLLNNGDSTSETQKNEEMKVL